MRFSEKATKNNVKNKREISLNFVAVSENLNLKIAHFENKVPLNSFELNLQGKIFNSLKNILTKEIQII